MKHHEESELANSITRSMGLLQSAFPTILKMEDKFKDAGQNITTTFVTSLLHHEPVMEQLKGHLKICTDEQARHRMPHPTALVMTKVLLLCSDLKKGMPAKGFNFRGSKGWLEHFKSMKGLLASERTSVCHIKVNNLYLLCFYLLHEVYLFMV